MTSSSDNWAKVQVIHKVDEQTELGDPTPDRAMYKIDHTQTGWRVIHRDTAKMLLDRLGTRADAESAVDQLVAEKRN